MFLERFKAAFSSLGVLAASYLPRGYKDAMLDMAAEVDRLKIEIDAIKRGKQ